MEVLNKPRCQYYKLCLAGLEGQAVITVGRSGGLIRVEAGKIPAVTLPFCQGYPAVWLIRSGDTAFFVGALAVNAAGGREAVRSFYPFNAGGTGKVIEEFSELWVTMEKNKRPIKPGNIILYRQTIGCFTGRFPPVNPLFYELDPFNPPLRNYRWWGTVSNLYVPEPETVYPVKCRKKGVC